MQVTTTCLDTYVTVTVLGALKPQLKIFVSMRRVNAVTAGLIYRTSTLRYSQLLKPNPRDVSLVAPVQAGDVKSKSVLSLMVSIFRP